MMVRGLLFVFFLLIGEAISATLSDGQDTTEFLADHIEGADVMVFAKSYCPHCKRTKDLLEELHIEMEEGWSYDVVDLDLLPDGDGPKIQAELAVMTGQRTVPNIFLGGEHVGGNSDLQAMHAEDKALEPKLQELADAHGEDL